MWADENGAQNTATNADLHVNFRLNNGGEKLGLFAPDGISPQHTVSFALQFQNISQGLFPDGAVGSIHFMTNWTPRAPNQLGAPPAPAVMGVTTGPGVLHFNISALPGRSYQVEYKNSLDAPVWLPIGSVQAASTNSLVIDVAVGAESQRFFRLRLQ